MTWRWWLPGVFAFLLLGCRPDLPAEQPVASWRFAGGSNVLAAAAGSPLAEVLRDARAPAVLDRLVLRVAEAVAPGADGVPDPETVAALEPVVRELLRRESAGVLGGGGWWMAARGDEALAAAWRPMLPRIGRLGAGTGIPDLVVTNGWVRLSAGRTDPQAIEAALSTPASVALELAFDPGRWLSGDGGGRSRVALSAVHTNGVVRWEADVEFPESTWGTLEPWAYPVHQIREPLVMFTAARGLRPLLSRIPWLAGVAGGDLPGQFVAWGQPKVPFRTWLAAPVAEDSGVVRRLHDALRPWFDPASPEDRRAMMGRLALSSNEMAMAILLGQRMEAISPAAGILREGDQSFLQMSLFAPEPSTNRIPDALRDQFHRDRTAFYQFEITGESILHWNALLQLGRIVLGQRPSPTNAPAHGWLVASVPRLGESVTHGELVSATHLRVTRKSPIGLSGPELVALGRWLDGPPGRPALRPPPLLPQDPAASDR